MTSAPAPLPSGVVTFLLSDVVGSTRLWEQHADLMVDALNRHDELVLQAVTANHGVLLKSKGEGDSTFNIFQQATHAAAAALAVQRAMRDEEWPPECRITTRIALHTGEAVERDGDYFGRTVNRVARLRGIAGGGEILVSRATADLVVDQLPAGARLVELGVEHLRDLDRPETVFLLTDLAPDAVAMQARTSSPLRGLPLPSKVRAAAGGTFVGREPESEMLRAAWDKAVRGTPGFVLVEGEPGIGKSRLVSELAAEVHTAGAIVLTGRCDEAGGSTFQPFAEAVRFVVERVSRSVLQQAMGARVDSLGRLVPDLLPTGAIGGADDTLERERLFAAVSGWLEALTSEAPALLLLEDLHWASTATIDLLRSLLSGGASTRLLIIGTARRDESRTNPLRRLMAAAHDLAVGVEHLQLDGLDAVSTSKLLESVGGGGGRDLAAVYTLTGGNPLFALAVATSSAADGPGTALPATVSAVIDDQLAHLDDVSLDFLRAAAVLGTTFEVDLAGALAGVPSSVVEHALDAGERFRIVREQAAGLLYLYEFSHALIATGLVETLTSIRRRRLHADAVRLVSAADLVDGNRATRVARHAAEAGSALEPDVAIESFRSAARAMRSDMAPRDAVTWLQRAKAIADALPDGRRAIEVDIELGGAQHAAGDPAARPLLADAADRALALGDHELAVAALAASDIGTFSDYLMVDDRRLAQLEATLRLCPPGDSVGSARVLIMLASELTFGDQDGRRFGLADAALAMARRLGDQDLVERVFEHRLQLFAGLPFIEQRLQETDEMMAFAATHDTPAHRRFVWLGGRSQVFQQLGRTEEGLAALDEMARVIPEDEQLPRHHSGFAMHQAGWEILRGDLDAAEKAVKVAFRHLRASASPMMGAATARQLLGVRFWQGRVRSMLPAIAMGASINPDLIAHHAYWLLQDGQLDDCAVVWDGWDDSNVEALITSGGTGESAVIEAAGVCAAIGAPDRCRFYYDVLAPYSEWLVNPFAPDQPTHHYLGLLAHAIGDDDLARSHFESSLRFAEQIQAPLMAGRASLELARLLLDDADRTRAVELIRRAEVIGRSRSSAWLVDEAASLLAGIDGDDGG